MAERKLSLAESKFRALLGIIDALPGHTPDDTPLRSIYFLACGQRSVTCENY